MQEEGEMFVKINGRKTSCEGQLRIYRRRLENNIRTDLQERVCEDMFRIQVSQDCVHST
jgi:hypothetical protein